MFTTVAAILHLFLLIIGRNWVDMAHSTHFLPVGDPLGLMLRI